MRILARIAIMLLVLVVCRAAEVSGFRVTKTYSIPGEGGFDHIVFDPSANRLYVSHGTLVNVVDAQTGKHLGNVEGTPEVHGIAIVPALHRGFTSNEGDSTVSVFDTVTLKTIKKISVAKQPDFIFYDLFTKRVLVCHEDGQAITAIDPERTEIVGKVDLGSEAEAAVVWSKELGFVNLEKVSMVASFDPQRLVLKQRWPIPGCTAPVPLAVDSLTSRLFAGGGVHNG